MKRNLLLALLALCLLLVCAGAALAAPGETLHVDASFSGVGDGSAEAPYTSLSDAVAAAKDGAIIQLHSGVSLAGPSALAEGKSLTIRGADDENGGYAYAIALDGVGFSVGNGRKSQLVLEDCLLGGPGAAAEGAVLTIRDKAALVLRHSSLQLTGLADNTLTGVRINAGGSLTLEQHSYMEISRMLGGGAIQALGGTARNDSVPQVTADTADLYLHDCFSGVNQVLPLQFSASDSAIRIEDNLGFGVQGGLGQWEFTNCDLSASRNGAYGLSLHRLVLDNSRAVIADNGYDGILSLGGVDILNNSEVRCSGNTRYGLHVRQSTLQVRDSRLTTDRNTQSGIAQMLGSVVVFDHARVQALDNGEYGLRVGDSCHKNYGGTLAGNRMVNNSLIILENAYLEVADSVTDGRYLLADPGDIAVRYVDAGGHETVVSAGYMVENSAVVNPQQGSLRVCGAMTIEEDCMLPEGKYQLTGAGSLTIPVGVTVTLPSGSVLYTADSVALEILGSLNGRYGPAPWYAQDIAYVLNKGLFPAVGGADFDAERPMTRAMFVAALWRMAGQPLALASAPFGDVDPDVWYAPAVNWAYEQGLIGGISGDGFGPDLTLTREMLAKLLTDFAAYQGQGPVGLWMVPLDYADAGRISGWALEGVAFSNLRNWLSGYDDHTFRPQNPVSRAEAATVIARYHQEAEARE